MSNIKKYKQEDSQKVKRGPHEWLEFVAWQREQIIARLKKYNNKETAKEQLDSLGDLSPYQHYKIETVSHYLQDTLGRIKNGEYGKCKYCGGEIPFERLLLVPAAVQCVSCDSVHE